MRPVQEDADVIGRVLVLTGPSSGGKSATAKAFSRLAESPWLILDADVVLASFPYERVSDLPATARRLNRGLFASVAAFAHQGIDVVCEQVFWSEEDFRAAVDCLDRCPVRIVEIKADLDVAEKRERGRSERVGGTARQQHEELFANFTPDHVLNTSNLSSLEAGTELMQWVALAFPKGVAHQVHDL